jgi:triosephosphate isomerase
MRRKLVAANWKMNLSRSEAESLIVELAQFLKSPAAAEVICFTPFPYLMMAVEKSLGTSLMIGAQNCSAFVAGAYTGEVSASMLASCGAKAVIIGHSERRTHFHEEAEALSAKLNRAIEQQLMPVWCCGESLEQRKREEHFQCIEAQIKTELSHLSHEAFFSLVIAYEPVWAIGTGLTASAEQAQEMHAFIRKTLADMFGESLAAQTRILYGGSCNATNAATLFALPDVDGGLIGGASLKSADFIKILEAAQ